MRIESLRSTFQAGGYHVMNPLRPNHGHPPTLAEFPHYYELGDEIRLQQEFYGRPTLANSEIAVDDLTESMDHSADNLLAMAQRNRGHADSYRARVNLGDRIRNVLGALSLAGLTLVPLGGGYALMGGLGAVALGAASGLTHLATNSQREWQRTYEEAIQEQQTASRHLRRLAADLQADKLRWEVTRQQAKPVDTALEVEVESLEDAVAVGDHVLPMDLFY